MELGWIDFTEEERKNTLTLLDALREPTAVDELGIGAVRDAFADKLFPGTSTLLRRTKYFFLVAYALYDMERAGGSNISATALRHMYDDIEKETAIKLLKGGYRGGVIGQRSLRADFSGPWVSRGPGEIYWAPLRTYGLLVHPSLSYFDYFKYLAAQPPKSRGSENKNETGAEDDYVPDGGLWHFPKKCWRDWNKKIIGNLTKEEAIFLKQQIVENCSTSLMAEIIQNDALREIALQVYRFVPDDEQAFVDNDGVFNQFFEAAVGHLSHRKDLLDLCTAAVRFSSFVYACRIRYNIQIPDSYELASAEWEAFKETAYSNVAALNIEDVYAASGALSAAGLGLYPFLTNAREQLMKGDSGVPELDRLVKERERRIKRNKAKIGRQDLEHVSWRGGRFLPYRFLNGLRIVSEIDEAGGFDA